MSRLGPGAAFISTRRPKRKPVSTTKEQPIKKRAVATVREYANRFVCFGTQEDHLMKIYVNKTPSKGFPQRFFEGDATGRVSHTGLGKYVYNFCTFVTLTMWADYPIKGIDMLTSDKHRKDTIRQLDNHFHAIREHYGGSTLDFLDIDMLSAGVGVQWQRQNDCKDCHKLRGDDASSDYGWCQWAMVNALQGKKINKVVEHHCYNKEGYIFTIVHPRTHNRSQFLKPQDPPSPKPNLLHQIEVEEEEAAAEVEERDQWGVLPKFDKPWDEELHQKIVYDGLPQHLKDEIDRDEAEYKADYGSDRDLSEEEEFPSPDVRPMSPTFPVRPVAERAMAKTLYLDLDADEADETEDESEDTCTTTVLYALQNHHFVCPGRRNGMSIDALRLYNLQQIHTHLTIE